MIEKTVEQITDMINVENDVTKWYNQKIKGVSIDSRKVDGGRLFIPFSGENTDGHQYVRQAIESGAGAALWQKDVPGMPEDLPVLVVEDTLLALQQLSKSYRDSLEVKVIGVTGSNGKTTVKDMTASVFGEKYRVQKTEGNYNNHIGLPLTMLSLREDTEIAILEMGMSGRGEIELLSKLASPDAAIITNIGEAHLQDLGSREAIADAKLEITAGMSDDGTLVYLGDESLLSERVTEEVDFQTKTFGMDKGNDMHPISIEQTERGSRFAMNQAPALSFELPVLGQHNVTNALAAVSAASLFDVPFEAAVEGLKKVELTKMRMEWVEGKNGVKIINDAYNASPTSVKAAVSLVADLPSTSKKIVVLGDMLELGLDEELFHYQTGQAIDADKIDYVFTYGTLGQFIASGAKGSFGSERVFSFQDKDELVQSLQGMLQGGELILVKASRGIKLEEVVESLSH
ncbi:UDP-N-acetylmuramoyl-tripeptide--D-alanyl-D-alanine ligase [Domibacillus sp. DTU_2020_1001157_1_SI_ALB_TIR_016]|uniref:UDP-N-acetylmuramoyl-tripeptide--D-alanyl-D- alanine ligase n=1 Tax=Domibacillus sp. DTU_2020_1001157_1_SI_ALB_TIR_016 TaxID=3077789 RepID=UPI0028EA1C3A|nr:UDP-N-acetylmuramoyl-tripeptide--D-alanyl-D-alanine ligase [Domibacillus sp. DTU_2020_1001157_1_SI_ALB_TIR_016]WNS80407.1 UDP-N-acetylmuramoyl-tripeptide--D-alanyl-D-alanine ligase [Domibacillus sp. DTU_2020_1001157_1_SI_ALB_TIR_016]